MERYPHPTSREEKMIVIDYIKEKLLIKYGDKITAIGVYGSIGKGIEGPYSDIEMHVITRSPIEVKSYEFVYKGFKVELDMETMDEVLKEAEEVDDMWPIKTGSFTDILPVYDPDNFFNDLKDKALNIDIKLFKPAIRQFIIDEVYETMGKLRNAWLCGNTSFIRFAARDILWQCAKLLGLANKTYYSTRSATIKESLNFPGLPGGYKELAEIILNGEKANVDNLYKHCELLWSGINIWSENMGIEYMLDDLPF